PCSRKLKFVIPKKFIHNGNPAPEQWLDIGVINLEGAFDDEGRECVTNMQFWQLLFLYSALVMGVCWAMRKQGVAVRGVLKCGAVPAKNTKVRIVDLDYGPDPDDTLDEH
ncbi:hypothetical protein OSTOST_10871, partial [Ostertagia ostertagi]